MPSITPDVEAVVVLSGGLDSTTLTYDTIDRYGAAQVAAVSFDYGQRHRVELEHAHRSARRLGIDWRIIPLDIGPLLVGSSLTDPTVDVPEGHYEAESMRATVVPNRNAIMLCVATAVAVTRHAGVVATAVHAGDHAVYPDCRPLFIGALERALRLGNEGFIRDDFALVAPYVAATKADIVRRGHTLGVEWRDTWSCYKGGRAHCGACGTCVERREAFVLANVIDPTVYLTDVAA